MSARRAAAVLLGLILGFLGGQAVASPELANLAHSERIGL
jgi:hypothetical protein